MGGLVAKLSPTVSVGSHRIHRQFWQNKMWKYWNFHCGPLSMIRHFLLRSLFPRSLHCRKKKKKFTTKSDTHYGKETTLASTLHVCKAALLVLPSVAMGFPGGSCCEESTCSMGDLGSAPGLGRFPWRGAWPPSPPWRILMDRGTGWAAVLGVAKSGMWLSD